MTLDKAVEDFIEAARSGWRSTTEEGHTRNQLQHHFGHMYDRPISSITKADVLSVLQPVWPQASVAEKLLSRIERVMRRAAALDLIASNPADGKIMRTLLPRQKEDVEHHPAVPWQEAPALWQTLSDRTGMAALALRLVVLTATRSGEVRKAEWPEFNLVTPIWTIPGKRTKTGKPLEVPLSSAALALLASIPLFIRSSSFRDARESRSATWALSKKCGCSTRRGPFTAGEAAFETGAAMPATTATCSK